MADLEKAGEGDPYVDGSRTLGMNTPNHDNSQTTNSPHVDIELAKEQFNELSRQLTSRSEVVHTQSQSSKSTTFTATNDIEKGAPDGERFDLREYLTSSNDRNQEAGIKHKVCISLMLLFSVSLNLLSFRMSVLLGKTYRWRSWVAWIARYVECPIMMLRTFLHIIYRSIFITSQVTWNICGGNQVFIHSALDVSIAFFLAPFLWLWSWFAPLLPKKSFPTRTILHKYVVRREFLPTFNSKLINV